MQGGDQIAVASDTFPPKGVTSTKYFLDGVSRELITHLPTASSAARYNVASNPDLVSFVARFEQETVLVGYPKVSLWVEVQGADDMDLFVLIQKLDAHGTPLQQFTGNNHGAMVQDVTERGASILRYKGSDGRLRASMRNLDTALSTDEVPAHTFDRIEKLSPGEIVNLEIDLLPIGLVFYPGEQLRLVVSERSLLGTMMPGIQEYTPANSGTHIIHTGSEYP